jgi:hypothetical protein
MASFKFARAHQNFFPEKSYHAILPSIKWNIKTNLKLSCNIQPDIKCAWQKCLHRRTLLPTLTVPAANTWKYVKRCLNFHC